MIEFSSSVLIVNHPHPDAVNMGVDLAATPEQAEQMISSGQYKVLVGSIDGHNRELTFQAYDKCLEIDDSTRVILITEKNDFHGLKLFADRGHVHQVLDSFSDARFEDYVREALECHAQDQQNKDLLNLANAQNEKLKNLSQELESKVQAREAKLTRSHARLVLANQKIEGAHRALMATHKAASIAELESQLYSALKDWLNFAWIRIFLGHPSALEEKSNDSNDYETFVMALTLGNADVGRVVFAKDAPATFKKDEVDFLNQIAETVALAVDRLTKLEQSESLKQQWESTFDSITEPICLSDENFKIIRTNLAFSEITNKGFKDLHGTHCFQAFFGMEIPEIAKRPLANFQFQHQRKNHGNMATYEVTGQIISGPKESLLLLVFRDTTESLRLQNQILESAKMAELGTIGSSIAHELNNPLGGMISFLQLLRMDSENLDIEADVSEMEKAGLRCKEIVENLLGFSRNYDPSENEDIDLNKVVEQALKITELQTRSKGIDVQVKLPVEPARFSGHFNLLSQALCNLLQNANDAITKKMASSPRFTGEISVELDVIDRGYQINIRDNGVVRSIGTSKKVYNPLFAAGRSSGLGLTLAYKIIGDHDGSLEISSQPKVGTTAKITLKRLENRSESQVFDSKI